MKKEMTVGLTILLILGLAQTSLAESSPSAATTTTVQVSEESAIKEDSRQEIEDEIKKRHEEERKRKEENERRSELSKRETLRNKTLQDRLGKEAQARDMEALREASADPTEYTVSPDSVELVVEMDPKNYGFRTRNHRMTITGEFDFLLRGRAMGHVDYRLSEFFSFGLRAGIDWTSLSLLSTFTEASDKPALKQFSVLGGISSKWRLTEWYMHSAFFLEPSFLFGHLWQDLGAKKTTHWRIRPGVFGNLETVYDSGFVMSIGMGIEFPVDFGTKNPASRVTEPLFLVALGLAI